MVKTERVDLKGCQAFLRLAALFLLWVVMQQALIGGDIYVDNLKGDDANTGTQDRPFQSIRAAAQALKGGDTLHMVPNAIPYTLEEIVIPGSVGLVELVASQAGTPGRPTVVDGHGSKVLGLFHYKAEKWQDEGSSVFSMKLPNNTVTMFNLGHWVGVIPIVFLDGQPAEAVKSREELVDGSFFLLKKITKEDPPSNTLFVKLPEGMTPADVKITAPSNITIQSNTSHVTFRNIESSYSSFDGFGSFWGDGLLFENLRASYNMNQGMSHHSSAGVLIRHCRFDHNVDCGVLDVSLGDLKTGDAKTPTRARYENCLIDNNVWLGGVRFQNRGEYEMDSCIITDNRAKTAVISFGSHTSLTLTNSIIRRGDVDARIGIFAEANSTLKMVNCTIVGYPNGVVVESGANVSISNCLFIDCDTALSIPPDTSPGQIESSSNCFVGAKFFKIANQEPTSLKEFQEFSNLDLNSVTRHQESEMTRHDRNTYGANLDPENVGLKM